jgi:hypothetical protein
LISDVRQKIERGELSIMGVMTFPSRGTEREPIPRLWASDFFFDVDAGRVHVVQFGRTSHVFVAVVIAGPAKPETPSTLAADPQREGAVSCSEKDSDKAASGSGDAAKPGAEVESSDREDFASEVPTGNKRRRFPRAELIAIACDRLQARKRLNKEEAHCLLAEFERLHPGRRPPAFREVLDHLRVIYDEAAKARAPRFPPDEE